MSSLLFADRFVLLVSSSQGLKHKLVQTVAKLKVLGSRSAPQTQRPWLSFRKCVFLSAGREVQSWTQVEKLFKYFRVLFTNHGGAKELMDRQNNVAAAVMRPSLLSVLVRKEFYP